MIEDELMTGEIRQMGLGLRWRRISAAQLQHSQVEHAEKPIPRGKEFTVHDGSFNLEDSHGKLTTF